VFANVLAVTQEVFEKIDAILNERDPTAADD
jgi:hypothetical protein